MSIKLYKILNNYFFEKNGFFSYESNNVSVPPFYQKPWQAYRVASSFVMPYEEDGDKKNKELKGEELVLNSFWNWYKSIYHRSKSLAKNGYRGDGLERETNYKNIKSTIDQLKNLKKQIEKDYLARDISILEYEENIFKSIDELIENFKELIKLFYKDKDKDEKKESPIEAEAVSLQKIIKIATSDNGELSKSEKSEILTDIAEKICEYLQNHGSNCVYKVCTDNHHISIIDIDRKEKILRIYFNDYLMLHKIYPLNSLKKDFPLNSHVFYERYWKPIVNISGFYYIDGKNKIIVPEIHKIPDIPKNRNGVEKMRCWDAKEKKYSTIEVSFESSDGKNNWFFKSAANVKNVSKDDLLSENTVVRCIDPKLESIYGEIGKIVQVVEHYSTWYVDVDFFNKSKIVRLPPNKIEVYDNLLEAIRK